MNFTGEQIQKAWDKGVYPHEYMWEELTSEYRCHMEAFANALPAKREGTPIDPKDVCVGDEIERVINRDGTRRSISGVVGQINSHGGMHTEEGGYIGNIEDESTFRLIHRPTPQLPTEAGSLIEAYEVRGVKGRWKMMLSYHGEWISSEMIGDYTCHYPKDVTAWKPADFVVRDGNE